MDPWQSELPTLENQNHRSGLVLVGYLPDEEFAVRDEVSATVTFGAGAFWSAVAAAFLRASAIPAMISSLCYVRRVDSV